MKIRLQETLASGNVNAILHTCGFSFTRKCFEIIRNFAIETVWVVFGVEL